MNDLIKESLDEYFSDFKRYHLIILIAFTIIIALIQVIQSILISKNIEKFKNDLKKSEIQFSKYNELQVKALNELYPKLSELLINTALIQIEINKASPEKINSLTKNWGESFAKVLKNFMLKRYILPVVIKKEYNLLIEQLSKLNLYIHAEQQMSSLYATVNDKVEFMGDNEERNNISEELKKLKKEGLLNTSVADINKLLLEIEQYFDRIE